jgi:hypothetical protein
MRAARASAWGLALIPGLLLATGAPAGQEPALCDPSGIRDPEAFAVCASFANRKYRDQAEAILDGFRPIGGDFPAMGEHWIQVARVFDGRFDPASPEILSYARVDGEPVLLGVAYAVPLLTGESPPDWPVGADAWHDHYGSLGEETFSPVSHMRPPTGGPRIAMLHAWLWAENPDGLFAADNWAIPYLKLGLEPDPVSVGAARALSLLSGGDAFFQGMIEESAPPDQAERDRFRDLLARTRTRAAQLVGTDSGSRLPAATVDQLARLWAGLAKEIPALDRGH